MRVPDDWKKAVTMPFFKKDKNKDPRNYRMVSPTSVYGKIMKQILLQGISRHMKDRKTIGHNKLGNDQSLDARRAAAFLYPDFSKAFDTVS